jgi:hypothetical protein
MATESCPAGLWRNHTAPPVQPARTLPAPPPQPQA